MQMIEVGKQEPKKKVSWPSERKFKNIHHFPQVTVNIIEHHLFSSEKMPQVLQLSESGGPAIGAFGDLVSLGAGESTI